MAIAISTTNDAIRAAHERRLAQLELRAARQGYETPPEVANEIKEIRERLGDEVAATPTSEPDRFKDLAWKVHGLAILADETRRDVRTLIWVVVPVAFVALVVAVLAIVLALVLRGSYV